MGIAEELKLISNNKTIDHALKIAEEYESKMRSSAEAGYTSLVTPLEHREDAHILNDEEFLEHLRTLLEGCEVSIRKTEHRDIIFKKKYYKYSLIISWA